MRELENCLTYIEQLGLVFKEEYIISFNSLLIYNKISNVSSEFVKLSSEIFVLIILADGDGRLLSTMHLSHINSLIYSSVDNISYQNYLS